MKKILLILIFCLLIIGCAPFYARPQESWPVSMVAHPTVSPQRNHIAFTVTRKGPKENDIDVRLHLFSMEDGTARNTGIEASLRLYGLAWSQDESKLVFTSGSSDHHLGLDCIDVLNMRISEISQPSCWTPKFSLDGTALGFVRGDNLIVRNVRSGHERQVAEDIDHWWWCWSSDGTRVFYVQNRNIYEAPTQTGTLRVLFSETSSNRYDSLSNLTLSPDGRRLGFYREATDTFETIDLVSGGHAALFKCDHYFLEFVWIPKGIVYLDAHAGERMKQARLMIYDTKIQKEREVAVGPFSHPQWLDGSKIILRCGNKELWQYDIETGQGKRLLIADDL